MYVFEGLLFAAQTLNPHLQNQKRPKQMHPIEHKSHTEQISVLKRDHSPQITRSGLVRIDLR